MKKSFKVILLTSLVILFLGIGLIVSGIVSGATWTDVGSVIFSGKYSFGTGRITMLEKRDEDIAGTKLEGESNILEDINAKEVERLVINMYSGELDIKEGESEYFQVNNKENRGKCFINQEGNEVEVTFAHKGNGKGAKGTFWIPKDLSLKEIEIRIDAGKIDAKVLKAASVEVELAAGQLLINDIVATDVEVTVDAGEFKSKGKIAAEKVDINVAAGNLKVDLLEANSSILKVDVGNIEAKLAGNIKDYRIEAECDLGRLVIDKEKVGFGHSYNKGESDAAKTVEIECNVGSAEIDFEK